jgi:hypothetical protein
MAVRPFGAVMAGGTTTMMQRSLRTARALATTSNETCLDEPRRVTRYDHVPWRVDETPPSVRRVANTEGHMSERR